MAETAGHLEGSLRRRVLAEVEDILGSYGAGTPEAIERAAADLRLGLPRYRQGEWFGHLVLRELKHRAELLRQTGAYG